MYEKSQTLKQSNKISQCKNLHKHCNLQIELERKGVTGTKVLTLRAKVQFRVCY